MIRAQVSVVRNVLPQYPRVIRRAAAQIVGECLRIGEATAKGRAPVLTGNLRNRIEVEHRGMDGTLWSRANYSGFVNFGTRRMAARPYFSQGAEAMRTAWVARWRDFDSRGMPRIR